MGYSAYLRIGPSDPSSIATTTARLMARPDTRDAGILLYHLHDTPFPSRQALLDRTKLSEHHYRRAVRTLTDLGHYRFLRKQAPGAIHVDGMPACTVVFSAGEIPQIEDIPGPEIEVSSPHPFSFGYKGLHLKTRPTPTNKLQQGCLCSSSEAVGPSAPKCESLPAPDSVALAYQDWADLEDESCPPVADFKLPEPESFPMLDPSTPDLREAEAFLDMLSGPGSAERPHWLASFDDTGADKRLSARKRGKLADLLPKLIELQGSGAGIYATIQEAGPWGCKAENVEKVRVLAVDLDQNGEDGLALVMAARRRPHMVVETSPNKFHCYWRVEGAPTDPEIYREAQLRLARIFGGDPKINDLARVMRVPGFLHLKDTPFRSRIIYEDDRPNYEWHDIARALRIPRIQERQQAQPHRSPVSGRHWTPKGAPRGQRNAHCFRTALAMTYRHEPDNVIFEHVMAEAQACDPPLPQEEVRQIVWSARRYAR